MVAIQWVGYPRSYTPGRPRPIQGVCLHYTAGSEGPESAEAGARYDRTRADGTSTHYFTDSAGPALQEVPDGDRAHTARQHGNEIFIHIEICGTAQTRAQWLDAVSYPTLRTTAGLVAILLHRHNLPLRRMTTAEVRQAYYAAAGSRPKGICEHYDCTKAFPEDQGDHSDVGAGFPWDVFMALVAEEYDGGGNVADTNEYDRNTAWRVQDGVLALKDPVVVPQTDAAGSPPKYSSANVLKQKLDAIHEAAKQAGAVVTQDQLDAAIKAALLDPEVLAALAGVIGGVHLSGTLLPPAA